MFFHSPMIFTKTLEILFKKEKMVLPGSAVLNQTSGICVDMKI